MAKVVDVYADDSIQFPRLLAEINAMGLSDEQYKWLQESMNLDRRHIDGLFARAEIEWERLKAKHCPPHDTVKRNLVVDGTDCSGHFVGDGQNPPFVVFDVDKQEIIAGPFKTRERAEQERESVLNAQKPVLNKPALKKWIEKIDNEKS